MSHDNRPNEERIEAKPPGQVKRRRSWWRWLFPAAVLLIAAAGAATLLNIGPRSASGVGRTDAAPGDSADGGNGEEETAVPVEVWTLESGEVSSYIGATANLVAEEDVTVVSETEGRVTVLNVEEGDRVRAGDILAVLDSEEEQIAVRTAESRRANASRKLERSADLFAKELVSRADHENLRVELEVAEQELEDARWRLERNTFRAPFTGVLTSRTIQVGQHVRPGDELFQVTNFDPLIARIHLPETDVLKLSVGRQVRLALNADATVGFSGRIRQISPVVDTATGTVKVTIEAHGAPAGVRPGSFVAVNVVSESRTDRVLVPKEAVLQELQSSHIFVARDGVAERRRIELGLEEGEWVEAIEGVDAGEQVVVAGQGGLKDGAAIRIIDPSETETGGT